MKKKTAFQLTKEEAQSTNVVPVLHRIINSILHIELSQIQGISP